MNWKLFWQVPAVVLGSLVVIGILLGIGLLVMALGMVLIPILIAGVLGILIYAILFGTVK